MSLLRLGAWIVLLLSGMFFLTTGGTYPGIASIEAHVVGQLIAIAVLGGWCVWSLYRPAWRASTPLLVPIALAAGAYLLSGVFSQRPRLSFEPLIAGLGWAVAYLFMSRLLAEGWFRARVAVVMTAFVAVVAFGYIAQVLIEWWHWWGTVGRFAVPPLRPSFVALWLGSPNLIGTALVLLAPVVVAHAWNHYRRKEIAVALAVASALAVFLSGSRGAWLGVGVGAILAVVLATTRGGGIRSTIGSVAGRVRARPVLALPVVALGAVGLVLAPSLFARLAQGGGTLRLDLWRSAITIFTEHPIFGAGPGTWVQLKVAANPAGVPNLILPHAHDMYVQAAAEVGVVGLLALAVLGVAVLRRLWSGWRSTDRSLCLESAAVLTSLAAFAAQSIVDNLVNLPMIVIILVTIVAWVDGGLTRLEPVRDADPAKRRLPLGKVVPIAVPVIALVGFAVLMPRLSEIDRAAFLSRLGSNAALRGHWGTAAQFYDLATRTDPGFTLYELQEAGALARIGRTQEARDVLAHAVESDPVAINVIGLAALEAQLGNRDAALTRIAQARALGIGEPTIALNAGLIAERLGERDVALDAFADALAWDPPLAGAGIWFAPPRLVSQSEVLSAARARVDELEAALLLAYGGSASDARAALATIEPSSRRDVYIAAATWLEGRASEAVASLEGLLARDPNDWVAAGWAARIGRVSALPGVYSRYARWASAVAGDAAPSVIAEPAQVPAGFDSPTAGLPGAWNWAVYLRPLAPYLQQEGLVIIGER